MEAALRRFRIALVLVFRGQPELDPSLLDVSFVDC